MHLSKSECSSSFINLMVLAYDAMKTHTHIYDICLNSLKLKETKCFENHTKVSTGAFKWTPFFISSAALQNLSSICFKIDFC